MVGVCFNFGRLGRLGQLTSEVRLGRLSSEHSGLLVAATGTLTRMAAVLSCCDRVELLNRCGRQTIRCDLPLR